MSATATGLPGERRSARVRVSGSVGGSDQRGAARVSACGPRNAFRLPRNAHEHALAHALASRYPRPGLPGGPEFPDKQLVLRLELVLVLDIPALVESGILKLPQHPK